MWIVLSINNSRYQCWQVSVLIWSIELSISYVSLKSVNITYVEMSYVLALLLERMGESSTHATHNYVEMLHQNKNDQLSVAQISPDQ